MVSKATGSMRNAICGRQMSNQKNNIQKVNVVNFPGKDKWDKSQIVVTALVLIIAIISLIVASISTRLYLDEINKRPDLYVSVQSPTPILRKAIFEFTDDVLSKPLEFNIHLQNRGDKRSDSLTRFTLIFRDKVEASLKPQRFWKYQQASNYKVFHYINDNLTVNPDTARLIGRYNLSIPKQTNRLLFALFLIEGDFERKSGLIYYDYSNERYNIIHFTNVHEAIRIWNKQLTEKEEALELYRL